MTVGRSALGLLALGAGALLAGCGGSGTRSAPATSAYPAATSTRSGTSQTAPPGALQAEANSAATGDIPDNQVFLVFRSTTGGWSMKYPEGWVQNGSGDRVTFRDKNNIVRVVVGNGPVPTTAVVQGELARLPGVHREAAPRALRLAAGRAVKGVYTTTSAPNPVTGKRVKLLVDRYYLGRGGRSAIVDLGTPVGVDNVDAYRLMIESFRWR
jgi:hypothetical protein